MRAQLPILILTICAFSGVAQIGGPRMSPAEQSIAFAKSEIEKAPSKSNSYNELAIALVRRARETSDDALYDQAESAVQKSLTLSPNNFEARKARVTVLLGRHEAAEARAEAQ